MRLRHAVLATLLFTTVSLNAGDADVVKYRQTMMKAMGSTMNAISGIAKGTVPFRDQLATNARIVKDLAHAMPSWFPASTSSDKVVTDAMPAVWTKKSEFAAAAKVLENEAARMEQLAKTNDAKAIAAQFDAMKKACGSCHDTFRMQEN